jgi:hypothetical protein
MTTDLQVLVTKGGAHFTDSQEKTESHKHVAKVWQDQCMTFEQGLEQCANDQQKIQDIRGPLSAWKPGVSEEGKLVLIYQPTSQQFVPTSKALKDFAVGGFTSEWFLKDLTEDKAKTTEEDSEVRFKRDRRDAELLVHTLNVTLFAPDRVDQNKERLFRTWTDGTFRAMLSDRYTIVNNQWYLETLSRLIPGGLLSHWRGDADTIFGNVLIPDTIRQESDSEYGGMLSIGNSEIGLRRLMSLPSVFRAICMNGCIWEQQKGKAVNRVHRGEVKFDDLATEIASNLQHQIPLLSGGIDRLLGTRALVMGNSKSVNVIAQFFKDFKLPKSFAVKFITALHVEREVLGADVRSLFGLQAALTRAGQLLDSETWVKYDTLAGGLMGLTYAKWDAMLKAADQLDADDVESLLGDVSHLMG